MTSRLALKKFFLGEWLRGRWIIGVWLWMWQNFHIALLATM